MHALFRSARQISLVDEHTLVLPSSGSALDSKRKVLPGCMDGADVDNDGQIELVVADACGSVYGKVCFIASLIPMVCFLLVLGCPLLDMCN